MCPIVKKLKYTTISFGLHRKKMTPTRNSKWLYPVIIFFAPIYKKEPNATPFFSIKKDFVIASTPCASIEITRKKHKIKMESISNLYLLVALFIIFQKHIISFD